MICPNCKQVMIVVEHHQVELDYCTKCKGAWFDSGELELFVESVSLQNSELVMRDILASPEKRSPHQERKCPVCNRRMKETAIGEPAIPIDVCRQGDGLWFDGGEVHQLLKQLSPTLPAKGSSQQQIITFLGEVFKAEQ